MERLGSGAHQDDQGACSVTDIAPFAGMCALCDALWDHSLDHLTHKLTVAGVVSREDLCGIDDAFIDKLNISAPDERKLARLVKMQKTLQERITSDEACGHPSKATTDRQPVIPTVRAERATAHQIRMAQLAVQSVSNTIGTVSTVTVQANLATNDEWVAHFRERYRALCPLVPQTKCITDLTFARIVHEKYCTSGYLSERCLVCNHIGWDVGNGTYFECQCFINEPVNNQASNPNNLNNPKVSKENRKKKRKRKHRIADDRPECPSLADFCRQVIAEHRAKVPKFDQHVRLVQRIRLQQYADKRDMINERLEIPSDYMEDEWFYFRLVTQKLRHWAVQKDHLTLDEVDNIQYEHANKGIYVQSCSGHRVIIAGAPQSTAQLKDEYRSLCINLLEAQSTVKGTVKVMKACVKICNKVEKNLQNDATALRDRMRIFI